VTWWLFALGARRLVAVEPDPALAEYLSGAIGGRIEIVGAALEEAELPGAVFDLAVAASSFHWVEEADGLAKIAGALRPGGWWAMWWTLFGDDARPDPFRDAADPLLDALTTSPSEGTRGRPRFPLDVEARTAALEAAGFAQLGHELVPWSHEWDTDGIRALYSTFSPIARLDVPRRTILLDAVARVADEQFGGQVARPLLTSLYTARRPA
jgi:Methyltransferase domain